MNKIDFILLYDVLDANPNGDPDGGNMPRIDPETGYGLVTDVCLKRKIRNYVQLVKGEQPGYDIYVKEKTILIDQHERAYKALEAAGKKPTEDDARKWMCRNFYDVRTFGAVMGLKVNCGQVRGPVQISFSRSMDEIAQMEYAITRCALATRDGKRVATDSEKEGEQVERSHGTMGRKYTVPYALYMAKGTINPFLASQTGFEEADLALLKEALVHMFDFDASAARPAGSMVMRKVLFFVHDSELGSAPSHKIYECVKVSKKPGVEVPRCFADYDVQIAAPPAGVTMDDLTKDI